MTPPLHIVIPVYNEGANFPQLRSALISAIHSPFEVFVIYDFDEDNTIPVVQRVISEGDRRFHLVKNSVRRGVVGAILTGFRAVERGPVLVVMGDLSDDLNIVDQMADLYRQGFHLVSPSRYMPGGRMVGGPFLKRNLSRWAGITLHWLRRLPTSDATNAFKLYDAEMLRSMSIESRGGFEISLEITVKAFLEGYRIVELPTTWQDRSQGESRFRLWHWLPLYLRWYFHAFRPRSHQPRPLVNPQQS
ncbi:MAG TPA: glycosyltransferase [Candidatus Acidoferrales bacterium]|nr:glycosyltransferase [Candidatus Acidoferrales bacterium]